MRELKIIRDTNYTNPRDNDNLGKMISFHKRYRLGDKHRLSLQAACKLEHSKKVISLPIYMLDHSGISISTKPFDDVWDSGRLGFIYVDRKKVREEYDVSRITPNIMASVIKCLSDEIKVYNAYLRGDVYGYRVYVDGDLEDSCGDMYMIGTNAEFENDCLACAGGTREDTQISYNV